MLWNAKMDLFLYFTSGNLIYTLAVFLNVWFCGAKVYLCLNFSIFTHISRYYLAIVVGEIKDPPG